MRYPHTGERFGNSAHPFVSIPKLMNFIAQIDEARAVSGNALAA